MFCILKNTRIFVISIQTNNLKPNIMTTQTMKSRIQKELTKMGYSNNEAQMLIEKFWNQTAYLKTAREKALYIIA